MNNLMQELVKSSEKNAGQQVDMVQQAKQLLSSNDAEERRLLSNIGLDAEIVFYEKQNLDLQEKNKQREFFKKPIVTMDEIKSLCFKYRLYFRNSNQYVGKIPTYLGAVLNRFVKEHGLVIGQHSTYSDFYVIAPPKMFSDYQSPAEAIRQTRNKLKANYHKMMNPDPILLYKLANGTFVVVESWGNDFTLVRRMKALWHSNFMITAMFILITVALPFYVFFWGVWSWLPPAVGISFDGSPMRGTAELYFITGTILSLVFIIFWLIWIFNEDFLRDTISEYKDRMLTKNRWDSSK